ncbi:hypothetical protein QL285_075398 [Trifolium repens]|nr:hypothetical protein QL285_075398 [Trifolium repens]
MDDSFISLHQSQALIVGLIDLFLCCTVFAVSLHACCLVLLLASVFLAFGEGEFERRVMGQFEVGRNWGYWREILEEEIGLKEED